ncbi:hypothetical protein LOK49_LG06G01966 [Camellia lanceoleosa]|uniref:Uncharacterized protein n=1 Tax=Camellia lanceoleosa TaxID=1840588 RepID=A0ACC0HBJ8_9ERIC|nr:hypothetical protein LOK49_LG06G01966 [Camellia lanceoleosa]
MSHQEGTCFTKQISMVSSARTQPSQSVTMALLLLPRLPRYWKWWKRAYISESRGVSIFGGTLDGQGTGLWACKASARLALFELLRPFCMCKACVSAESALYNSKNIVINGLTSLNSQMFHIAINGCHNVKVQRVKVSASGSSPNTDGIHIQLSSGVTISNSRIATGDDCVSMGPGSSNLWIENVACGPGHGISKKYGCKGIRLEDVKLTFGDQLAEASCVNVGGSTSGSVEPTSCL